MFPRTGAVRPFFAPRYAGGELEEQSRYRPAPPPSVRQGLPKLTAVTMVRNEHSRIHDAMRHFCALFDRVVVIDHRSDDDTARIALGYNGVSDTEVIVLRGEDPGYYQSEYMTACANAMIRESATDWIFFLDVDEFLPFRDAREFRQALTALAAFPLIRMAWRNIALKELDPETVQGIAGFMGPRSHLAKIAVNVPALGRTDIIVKAGNHAARRS